jgi:Uma2 family endonuclease
MHAATPLLVRGERIPMTYEEFPTWAPNGMRTEWTDGEGIVYRTNSDRHQSVVVLVVSLIETFSRLFGQGRVSFSPYPMLLGPTGPHREPDVLFVRTEHLDRWTRQRLHGPADLAVEVLSEDSAAEDLGRKRIQFEALGVTEYLTLDAQPDRHRFAYFRLNDAGRSQVVAPDADGHYHSAVLSGFWFDPSWFQNDPLPDVNRLLLRIAPDAYRRHLESMLAEESS